MCHLPMIWRGGWCKCVCRLISGRKPAPGQGLMWNYPFSPQPSIGVVSWVALTGMPSTKKTGTSFCVLLRQQCPLVSSSASCFLPTELMIRCFQRSLLSWLCRWCLGCGWVLSLGGRGRLRNGPAIHPTWNASPPISFFGNI